MILSKAVNVFILALVSDGYSSVTIDNYRRFMTKIATLLGDPPLEEITKAKLRNVFTSLRQQGREVENMQWTLPRCYPKVLFKFHCLCKQVKQNQLFKLPFHL